MKNRKLNILILEDSVDDAEFILMELKKTGFYFSHKIVETEKDFLDSLNNKLDLIISDFKLPAFDGKQALKYRQELLPDVPFIISSGTIGEEIAVDCMKAGATDYVMKDKLSRLGPVVKRALKEAEEKVKSKVYEQNLRKQEKFSAKLLQTAGAIILLLDINGNIISANKFLETVSGYKINEVLNKNWFSVFIQKEKQAEIIKIQKESFLSKNDFFPNKNNIICKDGTLKLINWRNTIITSENIEDKKMLCVGIDISEQLRNQEVQSILYEISNSIIFSDDDNLDKIIVSVKEQLNTIIDTNNFYLAFYDEKTDTITLPYFTNEKDNFKTFPAGKTLANYVIKTKKSLLATKDIIDKLVEQGKVVTIGADSKVWLGVPLIVNGKVTGVITLQSYKDENAFKQEDLSILEFVSEHIGILLEREKSIRDLKIALEKAQESDKLKSAFLATMSHELRTPLNSIIGFSDIIKSEFSNVSNFAERILRNGEHLLEIIEDMFDISIIETGDMKVVKEKFSLKEKFSVLNFFLKIETKKNNKENLDIIFKPDEKSNIIEIYTDKKRFKQIFINLLKNAIKFTDKGFIEYGYKLVDDKNVTFYVKDTGIGIPKEKQKIIFEHFRQIDDSYTRKYEGVGLGLSISKKIVRLLGGKMWLDSEIGKGSTFYFSLPCNLCNFVKIK